MDPEEKKAIMDEARAKRGYLLPAHEFMIDLDPEWFVESSKLRNFNIERDGAISRKWKEIILIVALCVRLPGGDSGRFVKSHIRQALKEGATLEEIAEALETATFPTGNPTFVAGITFLQEVMEEQKADKASE